MRGRGRVRSEADEQAEVVRHLRRAGYLVFSVPNEAAAGKVGHLQHLGLLKGAPDLILPLGPIALEMKRADLRGPPLNGLSRAQKKVRERMIEAGWTYVVGYGAADALEKLRTLGYSV